MPLTGSADQEVADVLVLTADPSVFEHSSPKGSTADAYRASLPAADPAYGPDLCELTIDLESGIEKELDQLADLSVPWHLQALPICL